MFSRAGHLITTGTAEKFTKKVALRTTKTGVFGCTTENVGHNTPLGGCDEAAHSVRVQRSRSTPRLTSCCFGPLCLTAIKSALLSTRILGDMCFFIQRLRSHERFAPMKRDKFEQLGVGILELTGHSHILLRQQPPITCLSHR